MTILFAVAVGFVGLIVTMMVMVLAGDRRRVAGRQRRLLLTHQSLGLEVEDVRKDWVSSSTKMDGRSFAVGTQAITSSGQFIVVASTRAQRTPKEFFLRIRRAPGTMGVQSTTLLFEDIELEADLDLLIPVFFPEVEWAVWPSDFVDLKISNKQAEVRRIIGERADLEGQVRLTMSLAAKFEFVDKDVSEVWWDVLCAAAVWGEPRSAALKQLITVHRKTVAGQRAWKFVMEKGNLHDVLVAINERQKNALAELHPKRLVSFVNHIAADERFDRMQLARVVGKRFDTDALLDQEMALEARLALLTLWGLAAEGSDGLVGAIGELLTQVDRSEIAAVISAVAASSYGPGARALSDWSLSHDRRMRMGKGPTSFIHGDEVLSALRALAVHGGDAGDTVVEDYLFEVLELDESPDAVELLGHWGSARALLRLQPLAESGLGLSPQARRASAAIELVEARLARLPGAGALTISDGGAATGALSIRDAD